MKLRWAVFKRILIVHMHDSKPCVMMESIKNVAVSDLDILPSFLLLNLSSFHLSVHVTKVFCM